MTSKVRGDVQKFHVSQRLSFEGALCTVRYIGPVDGTVGEWLGVEWDDPTRGKNFGHANGKEYFRCKSKSLTAASFVRPARKTDQSQSFVSAVRQKYASDVAEGPEALKLNKEIEISGKLVEEVGFDKIRRQQEQLQELKIVIVDGLRIDRAEDNFQNIEGDCPKIIELDLSRNFFEDCREIEVICGKLKQLKSLRLNGNRLQVDRTYLTPYLVEPPDHTAFSKITELELDDTLLCFPEIWTFVEAFPSLKTLTANGNELKSLHFDSLSPLTLRPTLTSLTLEYNKFISLSDLAAIVGLKSLTKLHLKGNQIRSLAREETDGLIFSERLVYVDLSYNDVHDWNFVDHLPDVFPGLTSLRFSHNPIYENVVQEGNSEKSNDETYMLTLARLKNLKSLNFSNITPAERMNAEMFYLSKIGKAMAAVPLEAEPKIVAQHRRYIELSEQYGAPQIVRADSKAHPDWLDSRLINFTFYISAGTFKDQDVSWTKIQEIPKTFDIYQVKGIVGKIWDLPPLQLRLIWETEQHDPVAGYEDDEEDSDEEEKTASQTPADKTRVKGKWVQREVELEESTRQVGFTIDETKATVRVELRSTYSPPYE